MADKGKIRVVNVVGARPNFVKIAPIIESMKRSAVLDPVLLHTGQHYDYSMSESFFRELQIPEPDAFLNVGSGSQAAQVAAIMEKFDEYTDRDKPGAILVVGDVNSTMACSLVAVKKGIRIVHVEAGIRSRDHSMPEEINRLVTDAIADILLPPSADAVENLRTEGIPGHRIFLVGNVMIDTLMKFQPQISASNVLDRLSLRHGKYAVLTLHRPSNVDAYESLFAILEALGEIQKKLPVVFPVHPRTFHRISSLGLEAKVRGMSGLIMTDPLGYFDFSRLVRDAFFVMTDSGGIQEETTVYGVPCITIRENTERPVTVEKGTNELAGVSTVRILELVHKAMDGTWKKGSVPALWDGQTAGRITQVLEKEL
ncbi:MAG: UDP-N-acetylglucosamine 2-epimerase (non-hydrolyzing) [Bacteroidales bacterium]|nr:UDP-N-acetylglucosamine 2-epimerase (non-hydrolyzing) [Bacteroidales bacterium]